MRAARIGAPAQVGRIDGLPVNSFDEPAREFAQCRASRCRKRKQVTGTVDTRCPDFGSCPCGSLLKQHVSRPDIVRRAVRDVGDGGCYVDPDVVELLVHRASSKSRLAPLTPRELEVLAQMARGRSNTAIASRLVVTERAIEKHINSLFSKLGLAEEDATHRRVTAVLLYLDERP